MSVLTSTIVHVSSQIKKKKFHPLEVVSRYRETQLQVGENLNKMTW